MIKFLAFLKLLPTMPREDAIAYYETNHVPLILSIMPGIAEYRRNFLETPMDGFDVVTELWFADQSAYDRAMAAASEAMARIAADEENFLDRSATRLSVVAEHGGPIGG